MTFPGLGKRWKIGRDGGGTGPHQIELNGVFPLPLDEF